MKKDPVIYLQHILQSIDSILEYTQGYNEETFLKSKVIQDATIRNLEIIGEATKQLPLSFRNKYADIEWKKMAGMRDKLIHDYIDVDMWAVWGVVDDILPGLRDSIKSILDKEKS